ncbi:MAG TPA: hypothetical protein PLE19_05530 [Planctomycetota bacterium]|nr:hypothetical protein [Planctomycetota bacterium]HRR80196.1 hypothetical protein [Planctomycetota bacterium]HRT93212.1 hypothetical protein [Planctomycetota bacterium]
MAHDGQAISRRALLRQTVLGAGAAALARSAFALDAAQTKDWLGRWEKYILDSARTRYCDKETGEEIGWLISPFLNGFAYGYLATRDTKWLDLLVDWADAWIKRGVKEPDGFVGWPKAGTGGAFTKDLLTDSQLGEAMGLLPLAIAADAIRRAPALKGKYGAKAEEWLTLNEKTFAKWDSRGAWREAKPGGVWVVPPFGIDPKTNQWTEGYATRKTDGFSHPANKQNLIACWLIALHDATGKAAYRDRAGKWWQQMKARMRLRDDGKFYVWNYWDPAGPWDYKPDGSPKHWVGVHPNGGYYGIDLEGIVAAYEHKLVFAKDDIARLIATNRDFMWNQQVQGAKFQRIDGGAPDKRWERTPGVLWLALTPYDDTLRKVFEANHNPASWGGLAATPRYIAREAHGKETETR